jgi:flagellar assembly protein FliH
MAEPDFHILPPESLTNVKRWSPGALTDRPPNAERRAANQPAPPMHGRDVSDPAAVAALAAQKARTKALNDAKRAAERAGFDAGYGEGKALVLGHLARLEALTANMQGAIAQFEQSVADDLVALALDVARQVIRTHVATHPEALVPLVQEALRAVPEGIASGELQINPDDADLIRAQLGGELPVGAWRIVPDAAIARGGCRIVTRQCDVDASLPARWKRALQAMGRDDAWEGDAAVAGGEDTP